MKIDKAVWSLVLALVLSSCVDNLQLSEGGMTGTGITLGRITGFGSVYVNGIHYNVDTASFSRNGSVANGQGAFSAGEFVSITGTLNADGLTGTAQQVAFTSLVRGTVSAVSPDGLQVQVLGQTVHSDALTVLHGINSLSDLVLGHWVEVSGVLDSNGQIRASSVLLLPAVTDSDARLRVAGVIQQLDPLAQTLQVGALQLSYAGASLEGFAEAGLRQGQQVQIEARRLEGQGLQATATRIVQLQPSAYAQGTRLELEGVVTDYQGNDTFSLDGQAVLLNAATHFIGLERASLSVGLMVEVEGTVNAQGALQADEVVLRQVDSRFGTELQGQITALDSSAQTLNLGVYTLRIDNVSMLLQSASYSAATAARGRGRHEVTTFAGLQVGDYIEAHVLPLADGSWQVLRLDQGGRSN